jgi:hypothetical protein
MEQLRQKRSQRFGSGSASVPFLDLQTARQPWRSQPYDGFFGMVPKMRTSMGLSMGIRTGDGTGPSMGITMGNRMVLSMGFRTGISMDRTMGITPARRIFVVGNRLVQFPSGYQPAPSAYEYAVYFLVWVNDKYPPPPRLLWVSAHDLEHVLYPQFLVATEWPARSWKTVAGHLRKLTDWRQKDGRKGADRRGSSPVEYLIRGPRKRRPSG